MKNKLVLFLLFGVVIGMQASSAFLDGYNYDSEGYVVDQAGQFSQLDSPSKYKTKRMRRREGSYNQKENRRFDDQDDFNLVLEAKRTDKNKSLDRQKARSKKQKK